MPWLTALLRFSATSAYIFNVTTARQVSNSHRSPAQISHDLRQATASSRSSIALTDLEIIEQRLRGDSLDAIIADFATQALKPNNPRIRISGRGFGLCCSQPTYQRHCYPLLS
jgi:hypothetical protein